MKYSKIWILAAVATLGMTFASCDKDDEEETPATPIATTVSGSYTGQLIMSIGSTADTVENTTVTLARENDNTVKVTLPAYGEGRMGIPALEVSGVSVAQSGSSYTLAKNEYSVTVEATNYTGNISGTVANSKLNLDYTCQPGAMPMSINFTFSQN